MDKPIPAWQLVRRCVCCQCELYEDEPGHNCPDCLGALAWGRALAKTLPPSQDYPDHEERMAAHALRIAELMPQAKSLAARLTPPEKAASDVARQRRRRAAKKPIDNAMSLRSGSLPS